MSESAAPGAAAARSRIDAIDLARGFALVAMAIYHFTWDLEFFGYAEPGLSQQGGWRLFARGIASSFLFLVGISLVLAHGHGVRWRGFGKRLAQIVAAAALITVATWFATPDRFIFFGILHQIALASVLCLAMVAAPFWLTLAVAAAVIALPQMFRAELFAAPVLWWTGLAPKNPLSNDYVPVFPWTGAVLAGIAAGKLMRDNGVFERLATFRAGRWAAPIRFSGRHSLAFYLLHQPVLIGGLWLFAQIWPATAALPEASFMRACNQACMETGDETFCANYCACMLDHIDEAGRLDDVLAGRSDTALQSEIDALAVQCSAPQPEETQ